MKKNKSNDDEFSIIPKPNEDEEGDNWLDGLSNYLGE